MHILHYFSSSCILLWDLSVEFDRVISAKQVCGSTNDHLPEIKHLHKLPQQAWNVNRVLSYATSGNFTNLERCKISAIGSDVSSLVQQVLPRDPHIMKQSEPEGKKMEWLCVTKTLTICAQPQGRTHTLESVFFHLYWSCFVSSRMSHSAATFLHRN